MSFKQHFIDALFKCSMKPLCISYIYIQIWACMSLWYCILKGGVNQMLTLKNLKILWSTYTLRFYFTQIFLIYNPRTCVEFSVKIIITYVDTCIDSRRGINRLSETLFSRKQKHFRNWLFKMIDFCIANMFFLFLVYLNVNKQLTLSQLAYSFNRRVTLFIWYQHNQPLLMCFLKRKKWN